MIRKIVEILGGGVGFQIKKKKKTKKNFASLSKAINHRPSFLESWNSELQNSSFDIFMHKRRSPPMQAFRI
jgi:hypothetical protein